MQQNQQQVIRGGFIEGTQLMRRFGYHGPHKIELAPLYVATHPRPPVALQVEQAKRQAAAHGYLQVIVDRTTFVMSDTERDAMLKPAEQHTYVLRLDGGEWRFDYRRGQESEVAQQLCAMVKSNRNPDGVLSCREYAAACCTLLNAVGEQPSNA